MRCYRFSLLLFALSTSVAPGALAQRTLTQESTKRKPAPPPVERITDSLYRIGRVMVDTKARTVTCPGVVNMSHGPVEYLAVAPGGKLHESVLRVDVRPLYVQLGLILLDLDPHNGLKFQGDAADTGGPLLRIEVRWHDITGAEHRKPAEELILVKGKPWRVAISADKHASWSFTGSQITRQSGFLADSEKSIVAVWHDPAAIIDNAEKHGGENTHEVSHNCPPVGTPIELIILPNK